MPRTYTIVFPNLYREMFNVETVYRVVAPNKYAAERAAKRALDEAIEKFEAPLKY